jgi:P-type E1-E2 ATPase
MIEIDVPGYRTLRFRHLVLDVNGTLAKDGRLIRGVAPILARLRTKLEIHLVTADTHGRQKSINRTLGMEAVTIPPGNQSRAKLEYIRRLGKNSVVAIGNGANDAAMLEAADLGIAVIGPEGAFTGSVFKADVVAHDIESALQLLLYPKRLMATLRR